MLLKFMEVLILLKFFNLELQRKDNKSGNKNKLKNVLTELRGFKFVTH